MIALGIVLAVLVILALIPVGVRFSYDSDGVYLAVLIWRIKLRILPARKKKQKNAPKKKKAEKKTEKVLPTEPPASPEKKGGKLTDFLPLVRVALDFLNDFRKKLRVDHLKLKIILAGDDPCDLAQNYGKACAAMGNFLPVLERVIVIRKRDINIECDFCADETTVLAGAELTITVGRMVVIFVRYGVRALREYLKINKKRKASAENEPKCS